MGLFKTIQQDLHRITGNTGFVEFCRRFFSPGFRHIVYFRIAKSMARFPIINIPFLILYRLHSEFYGFQIPLSTYIDEGFYIGHYGTIIINGNAEIGKNVNITTNVLIGQTNRGRLQGVPVISDNVYLGYGAVIVGGITIGENVLIAPNSYVNFDVPANSIVMGNPGKIIPNDNATKGYVTYPI